PSTRCHSAYLPCSFAWPTTEEARNGRTSVVVLARRRYHQVLVRDRSADHRVGLGRELWRALARRGALGLHRGRRSPGVAVPVGGPDRHLPELRRNTILAHTRDSRDHF